VKNGISQPVLIVLIVVGFLVAGLGGYFVLIRPQHAKAAALDTQIADTQGSIDSARALTLQARKVAKIRVADIFRLTKAMPDQTDMPDIILEGYVAIPITVEFQGNFYELADFLYRLRNLVDVRHGGLDANGRLFAIDTIDFGEAPPPPGFPQIRAHLVIDAFVYGTGSVPTIPAPSAAGASGASGASGATGAEGTTGGTG
jgi:type II secretory pathway pseudopilin PulG